MKPKPAAYKWWRQRKKGKQPTPTKLKKLLEAERKQLGRYKSKPTQMLVWNHDKNEWELVKL